jgi:hypothetical protein
MLAHGALCKWRILCTVRERVGILLPSVRQKLTFACNLGLNYLPLTLTSGFQEAGNGYQPPEYAVDGDRVLLRGCIKVSRATATATSPRDES